MATIQYFIDTPLVGLFSDNATNNINIPIRINYVITIITTYHTKCILKLNYNKILKYYHDVLYDSMVAWPNLGVVNT